MRFLTDWIFAVAKSAHIYFQFVPRRKFNIVTIPRAQFCSDQRYSMNLLKITIEMAWNVLWHWFYFIQCTLLVLIDFCPFSGELLTWSSVTKTFDTLPEKYYRISDLVLTFPHFEFLTLYLDIFDINLPFLCKKLQFSSNISKYRLKNSKWGKVKPRSDIP